MDKSKKESAAVHRDMLIISASISEYTNYDNITNPYNFKSWWNTLLTSTDAPYEIRVQIYECALQYLPCSYKLWYHYLKEARDNLINNEILQTDQRYSVINSLHERALIYLSKMPRIWLDYAKFTSYQLKIMKTVTVYGNALKSLPITQHEKIWGEFIEYVKTIQNCNKLTVNIFKRYLMFNPDGKEEYVDFLLSKELYSEVVKTIIDILNDEMFASKKKGKFYYWLLLCEIIERFPEEVEGIDCEKVIRHGIGKYTDEVGRLWVALGNYYIKLGIFGKARDVFEEALEKVLTARDFTMVFNSYLKFEEEVATGNIEDLGESEKKEKSKQMEVEDDDDDNINLISSVCEKLNIKSIAESNDQIHVDTAQNASSIQNNFIFLRLTNLLERRPFLLSSTLLRQNPNDVKQWLKKVRLYTEYSQIAATYEEALSTINPQLCTGRLSDLYISYAEYESQFSLSTSNKIFSRGTNVNFRKPDEIISIWTEWCEMHIKYKNYTTAYNIIKHVCTNRKYSSYNTSIKLWSLYVDLETALGSIENIRNIYDKIIEIKIANIHTIFNYTRFLEKNHLYEESFRVFERAIDNFTWPNLYDIYLVYIKKFIARYKGSKVERVRDIFETIISSCNKEKIKIFYYLYASYEEKYGLLNHCISILERGSRDVVKNERVEVISVLISKTAKYFGISKTRGIFEKSLNYLDEDQVLEIGLKFASIETKLGEITRARSIFTFLSQFCDPGKESNITEFWNVWEKFELSHGNVDTYQEMEAMKRSVKSKYSLNVPMFNNV